MDNIIGRFGSFLSSFTKKEETKAPETNEKISSIRQRNLTGFVINEPLIQKKLEIKKEQLQEVIDLFFGEEPWDAKKVNKKLQTLGVEEFVFCAKFFQGMLERLEEGKREDLDRLVQSGYSTSKKDSIKDLIFLQNAYLAGKNKSFTDPKERKGELAGKDGLQPKEKKELERLRLDSKIQKTKIYARYNFGLTPAKGATGTLKIYDEEKRLIGVFKPDTRYAGTSVRIKNFIKQKFFGQLYFLKSGPLAQPQAEVVSYELDRHFGFDVVPASALFDLGDKSGVFQVAAYKEKEKEDVKEAKDLLEVLNDEEREFKDSELNLFQRYILHDFLIGNLDAHEENWFVKVVEGKITGLVGIDKANSFLKKHAWGFAKRNQHKWGELKIAEKPFTKEMLELMKSLTEDKLDTFIEEIKRKKGLENFFDEEIEARLKERAEVLREFAEREGAKPSELAKLRTGEDFEHFKEQLAA